MIRVVDEIERRPLHSRIGDGEELVAFPRSAQAQRVQARREVRKPQSPGLGTGPRKTAREAEDAVDDLERHRIPEIRRVAPKRGADEFERPVSCERLCRELVREVPRFTRVADERQIEPGGRTRCVAEAVHAQLDRTQFCLEGGG